MLHCLQGSRVALVQSAYTTQLYCCFPGRDAAARASMLAINDATADAMLGTPDSDLWHNDMDNLLHNVNDLMRRLDQRQAEAGSEDADQEEDEGDGVFFAHEPGGAAAPLPPAAGTYTETQVRCALAGCCAFRQHTTVVERAIFCCSCSVATVSRMLLAASPVCCARGFWPCMHHHDCKLFITADG